MPNPVIKICGVSTVETVDVAIDAGADWLGFVSFEPSPRHIDLEEARQLADRARGKATLVSLTVDADNAVLDGLVGHILPDMLQCHGGESPARIKELKQRYQRPVIKALGISTKDDLAKIRAYIGIADYIMLDAKPPKSAILPGGNGKAFDWQLLKTVPPQTQYMLSGGLTPQTIRAATQASSAFGFDVSSGVEIRPGIKDPDLIRQFIKAARIAYR